MRDANSNRKPMHRVVDRVRRYGTLLGRVGTGISFVFITSTIKAGNNNGVTTDPINTANSKLIVVAMAWYAFTLHPFTDSYANTWVPHTPQQSPDIENIILLSCVNPICGPGHTFGETGSNTYPALGVISVGGASAPTFESENGAVASSGVIHTGNVSPSKNNSLLVTAAVSNKTGALSVDSGYTYFQVPGVLGNNLGLGMGYLIQTGRASSNPAWTSADPTWQPAATVAVFKPS